MKAFNYTDHNTEVHNKTGNAAIASFVVIALILIILKLLPLAVSNSTAKEMFFFDGATSDNQRGYVVKVNELLSRYIKDHRLNSYSLNSLISNEGNSAFTFGDSVMTFYLPADGDINGLRLISINRFDNIKDSLFYYNSKLPEHLALQKQNPDRRVFETKFMSKNGNDSLLIKSISIDESILSVPLVSDNMFWKQDVKCVTDSLFPNFLFVKMANAWLPLGETQNRDTLSSYFNPYGLTPDTTISFYAETNQFELTKNALIDNFRTYDIAFTENQIIKLSKIKDTLFLNGENIGDVEVLYANSTQKKYTRTATEFPIPITNNNFEIKFKNLLTNGISTISCTKENPFNELSYLVYHNHNNFRYAVSENNVDLFSAIVARKIPEIENVFYDFKSVKTDTNFVITSNPIIAKYINLEMNSYLANTPFLSRYFNSVITDSTAKMGVTLMNTATAAVIAAPWVDKTIESKLNYKELTNYNFVNHPIGSCFKPLLMFATYCKYPMLSQLKLNSSMISDVNDFAKAEKGAPQVDAKILNYPTKGFNGHSDVVNDDLNYALAKSSNLYPAINFLYSLTEAPRYRDDIINGSPFPSQLYHGNGTEHSVACRVLADSQLYANRITDTRIPLIYRQVFNVEDRDILINNRDLFDYNYWDNKYEVSYDVNTNFSPSQKLTNYSNLCPERVSLHFDLFRNNKTTYSAGNFRNEIVPWILGSQNNRWNNIKLCEGFCRLITGNNIRGSFLSTRNIDNHASIFNSISNQGNPAIQNFQSAHLDLLRALNYSTNPLQAQGTWRNEGLMVSQIQVEGINSSFVMLAKTGTSDDEIVPNNKDITKQNNFKTVHRGAFMFCIMTQAQFLNLVAYINSGYRTNLLPHKLGITGVISLELTDKGEESEVYYSAYARQFLTSNNSFLRNLILLNKDLFSVN